MKCDYLSQGKMSPDEWKISFKTLSMTDLPPVSILNEGNPPVALLSDTLFIFDQKYTRTSIRQEKNHFARTRSLGAYK